VATQDETARRVVHDELKDAFDGLDVGQPGSDRRRRWLLTQQRAEEYFSRQEIRKEQKRTVWVGVCSSVLVTVATTIATWVTGILPWLLSFSMPKK